MIKNCSNLSQVDDIEISRLYCYQQKPMMRLSLLGICLIGSYVEKAILTVESAEAECHETLNKYDDFHLKEQAFFLLCPFYPFLFLYTSAAKSINNGFVQRTQS